MSLKVGKTFFNYFLLFIFLILFLNSCANETYYGGNYYADVGPQKIRNSAAVQRATMRPYKVAGKWYYPTLAKVNEKFTGIASWYGPNFHSKKTSNGETYNMFALTAASKTLPMNTVVRVYDLENGKSVVVRINDRGPFVNGRIIDLSNKAARTIAMVKKGTAKVRLVVLGFHGKIATTKKEKSEIQSLNKYYLQVGAFRVYEGAVVTRKKFLLLARGQYNVIIKQEQYLGKTLNRVWVSGFRSADEAQDFKNKFDLKSASVIAQ